MRIIKNIINKSIKKITRTDYVFYGKSVKSEPFNDNTRNLIEQAIKNKGNLIELGVYRGGTSVIIGEHLKKLKSNKILYSCDAFKGYPKLENYDIKLIKGTSFQKNWNEGRFKNTSYEKVKNMLIKKGLNNIIIKKGYFKDTFKTIEDEKFCYAYIDCDLPTSTKQTIIFLKDRMVKGGIFHFVQYSPSHSKDKPSNRVIEKYFNKNNIHQFSLGGGFFVNG